MIQSASVGRIDEFTEVGINGSLGPMRAGIDPGPECLDFRRIEPVLARQRDVLTPSGYKIHQRALRTFSRNDQRFSSSSAKQIRAPVDADAARLSLWSMAR
jgi:hypothetical protein